MRAESSRMIKAQQRLEEASRREALANNRVQAEVRAKLRESREAQDREARRSDSQMRIESIKYGQLAKRMDDASQRAALENAQLQYASAAQSKAVREARDKLQRHEMSAMRLEGYRQVRQQRLFIEQQQLELLENDKIQSDLANSMRLQRSSYDKENRREMAAMRIETLKQSRLLARVAEAKEKVVLANNRMQADQAAAVRLSQASQDRDLRREMSAMRMEAYRQKQADRRAKEKAQMGRLQRKSRWGGIHVCSH